MKNYSELPLNSIISTIIDNRGKTCPTSPTGFPLIATNCIKNDRLYPVFENIRYITQNTYSTWFRAHPIPGDIILVLKGTPGRVAFVPDPVNFCIAQDMVAIRADSSKIYHKYLFAVLRSNYIQEKIESLHVGTLIPHFKKSDFKDLIIPIPSFTMQEYIGDMYFYISRKIDLFHRQNVTLEAMAEALFKQWFVVEAKEEWENGYLTDEFEITMGQSPSGTSFNELGLGIPMFQGNADFGFRFPSKRVYTTEPTRFAEKYDTLISVRAPVGAQNMANERCCIGRGLAAFRYKTNPSFYTYTYFKLRHLLKELTTYNDEGTVFGSISKNDFNNFVTQIPDVDSVNDYEKKCSPINNKISHNCNQIDILEKLRDYLLPKLMSSEVRVKF